MTDDSCRCGQAPEVVVSLPDMQFRASRRQNRLVSLDACISDTIIELWNCGVLTLGCCCGHNEPRLDGPSVIVCDNEDPRRVYRLLGMLDKRQWRVLQWQLVCCRTVPE